MGEDITIVFATVSTDPQLAQNALPPPLVWPHCGQVISPSAGTEPIARTCSVSGGDFIEAGASGFSSPGSEGFLVGGSSATVGEPTCGPGFFAGGNGRCAGGC